ncbi:MAG: hypothetical protein JKY56_03255 [Kofleriaceae bacterium]|nr:hypothetical protein [Kofleriaceae bacterium]
MNLARFCIVGCLNLTLGLTFVACGDDTDKETSVDAQVAPAVDAAGQTPDAFVANGCGPSNTVCTGETICVNDACESVFGRTYEFQVLLVMVETTDSNGQPWDINGGAPDPYVVVEINGTEVLRTDTKDNVFSAEYATTTLEVIPAGASIKATIFDSDFDSDDEVYVCEANPVTPQQLRDGAIICAAGSLTDAPSIMLGVTLN